MSSTQDKKNIANQLLAGNFTSAVPAVAKLSDPLVDTPMVVTIDQLNAYEYNPRITRNPKYEEIKLSIKERGLDAPPAITRRPGESHFIIRNGGNTRLSILRELWQETKDERFFKIHCLFRPWQNEIVTITGHLAESELHGSLTFIERALGVLKAQEFYKTELGLTLTQRQFAQQLTDDGYPISQTSISQINDVVGHLLPVIPNRLYGGMSKKQILKILQLRRVAKNVWLKYSQEITEQTYTFDDMFTEVISDFDDETQEFEFNKLNDELVGRIAQVFECTYDLVELEFKERDKRQRLLELPPTVDFNIDEEQLFSKHSNKNEIVSQIDEIDILLIPSPKISVPTVRVTRTLGDDCQLSPTVDAIQDIDQERVGCDSDKFINEHIISPIETTTRLFTVI